MLLLVDQSMQLLCKASCQISQALLVLPPSSIKCQVRCGPCNRRLFVLWYVDLKSVVTVQRKWRRLHLREKAPNDKAENHWLKQFKEMGSVVNRNHVNQEHWKRTWSRLDSPF
jgi:hypothetical protein